MLVKNIQKFCRLCAQEITDGFDVFIESEEKASLDILINKYLPIRVIEDEELPKKICEPCHIGMAATIDFLDRLVDGQQTLANIIREDQVKEKDKKVPLATSEVLPQYQNFGTIPFKMGDGIPDSFAFSEQQVNDQLCSINPETSNVLVNIQGDTPDVEMDDLAQGTETSKVYEQHPLMETVEKIGITKKRNKRKIGQPADDLLQGTGRPRRKANKPSRYQDSVSGADLEKLGKADSGDTSDLMRLEEGKSSLETMSCGNTVIITPNHHDQMKMPAAVNIELDFPEGNVDEPNHAAVSSVEFVMNPQEEKVKKRILDRRRNKRKKFFCDICKTGFLFKGRYLFHLRSHNGSTFHCNTCKEEFTTAESLKDHQKQTKHTGVGILKEEHPVECPECPDKVFPTSLLLQAHQSIHHKPELVKPFSCPHCSKKFMRSHSLKEHISYHHSNGSEVPKLICHHCGREFMRKASLDFHISNAHQSEASYVCSLCSKDFKSKSTLIRHCKLVHSDERPYKCNVCDARFKAKGGLKHHLKTHSEAKQYTCELCGKQFHYLTSLNVHIKIHQGAKDHECPWCGKAFIQKSNLREHMRIHTGERPFSCETCSKTFTTSSQLSTHRKKHKERFKCPQCRKFFQTKELLWEHSSEAHVQVPTTYTCTQCNQTFKEKRYLKRHMKIHAGNSDVMQSALDKDMMLTIPIIPSASENIGNTSPNVVYIISKKDEQEYCLNVLDDEAIFPRSTQMEAPLNAIESVQFSQFDPTLSKTEDYPNKVISVNNIDENFLKNNSLQFVTEDQNTGMID